MSFQISRLLQLHLLSSPPLISGSKSETPGALPGSSSGPSLILEKTLHPGPCDVLASLPLGRLEPASLLRSTSLALGLMMLVETVRSGLLAGPRPGSWKDAPPWPRRRLEHFSHQLLAFMFISGPAAEATATTPGSSRDRKLELSSIMLCGLSRRPSLTSLVWWARYPLSTPCLSTQIPAMLNRVSVCLIQLISLLT